MEQSDYDSPWKDALDFLFDSFISLFFPSAHAQIDWSRGFEFLDKESQKVTAGAAVGRFLDWVLWLPDDLETEFNDRIIVHGGDQKMEYVTPFERPGIRKRILVGGAEIILRQLQRRFGALDDSAHARIGALPMEHLKESSLALLDFSSLSDLEDWLQRHPLPSSVSGAVENGARREPGA
jgi:hypothetical protein